MLSGNYRDFIDGKYIRRTKIGTIHSMHTQFIIECILFIGIF